jgi:hypothetical protein
MFFWLRRFTWYNPEDKYKESPIAEKDSAIHRYHDPMPEMIAVEY